MSDIVLSGVGAPPSGGGDGKPKKSPVEVVKALQAAAKKGDNAALTELVRLRTMIQQAAATQAAMIQVLDAPEPEVVSGEDLYTEDEIFGKDAVDTADHVLRQMQSADSLTQKAALLKTRSAELAKSASWTRINPQSIEKTVLGNSTILPVGKQQEIARWSGDPEETTAVTITVGYSNPIVLDLLVNPHQLGPVAIITWGTKGSSQQMTVDIDRGFELTINASNVVVQVACDLANGELPGSVIALTGSISFLPCVKAQPATLTTYPGVILKNASTNTLSFPPFARTIQLFRASANAVLQLDVYDAGGNRIYGYLTTAAAGIAETTASLMPPLPLTGNAAAYTITNGNVADTNVFPFFALGC